jgi:hypothetical protein
VFTENMVISSADNLIWACANDHLFSILCIYSIRDAFEVWDVKIRWVVYTLNRLYSGKCSFFCYNSLVQGPSLVDSFEGRSNDRERLAVQCQSRNQIMCSEQR